MKTKSLRINEYLTAIIHTHTNPFCQFVQQTRTEPEFEILNRNIAEYALKRMSISEIGCSFRRNVPLAAGHYSTYPFIVIQQ